MCILVFFDSKRVSMIDMEKEINRVAENQKKEVDDAELFDSLHQYFVEQKKLVRQTKFLSKCDNLRFVQEPEIKLAHPKGMNFLEEDDLMRVVKNKEMTHENINNQLVKKKITQQQIQTPISSPVLKLTKENVAVLKIDLNDSEEKSYYKPNNVAYCDIKYDFEPVLANECRFQCRVSASSGILYFDFNKRGQICYCYARWVDYNGFSGPWSSRLSVQIPE